jgi:hypothetical protein
MPYTQTCQNHSDSIYSSDCYIFTYKFIISHQDWAITSLFEYCEKQFANLNKPDKVKFNSVFKYAVSKFISEL